jgi:zinc protease
MFLSKLVVAALFIVSSRAEVLTLVHKTEKLPNGLKVFMVKYPSPGTIAYEIAVRVGSGDETEKGKTGFAHFFEHLMFRGTKHLTSKQLNDLYVKLGVENNAETGSDMTHYFGAVAKQYLPRILEAEADRFQNLYFDEKALRDEAGAVLGEYNKDVASPEFQLEEKLDETAFKVHPYGHTTMGYKQDILKFTERYNDVWPFFRAHYRPSNARIVLVGDVDFDAAMTAIRKSFGGWREPKESVPKLPVEPEQTSARTARVDLDKEVQPRVEVAYKVPAFTTTNGDSAALAVLAEMTFSVVSDFQKKYRFDEKWVESVGAGAPESREPGLWIVELKLTTRGEGKEEKLATAIDDAVAKLRKEPPATSRLESTKSRLRNSLAANWFSSPDHLSSRIAWYTNLESDLEVVNRVAERLAAVTAADVQSVAKRYLTPERRTTVILRGKSK